MDAVLIRALNSGNGTGTRLAAVDLDFTLLNGGSGSRAYFDVFDNDQDSTPDQVLLTNPNNLPAASWIRVGSAFQTAIIDSTPTWEFAQPNPWAAGVSTFSVAAYNPNPPLANGATGTPFARLVVDRATIVGFTGRLAGEVGDPYPVAVGGNMPIEPPVFGEPYVPLGTPGVALVDRKAIVDFSGDVDSRSFQLFIPIVANYSGPFAGPETTPVPTTLAWTNTVEGLSLGTAVPTSNGFLQSMTFTRPAGGIAGPVTGTLVYVASNGLGFDSPPLTLTFAAVPEPTVLTVWAWVGRLAMARHRRHRRRP